MRVFEKLREACKADHLNIKHGAYAAKIMAGSLTLQEYQSLILTNYFFHGCLENSYRALFSPAEQQALQLGERFKLPFLRHDLAVLGLPAPDLAALPVPVCLPTNAEQALGAMYVTEGTAIGGAIIRRNLEKNPAIVTLANIAFYGCYGGQLSVLWKAFAAVLNRCEGHEETEQVLVEQAKRTFLFYEQLLEYFHENTIAFSCCVFEVS